MVKVKKKQRTRLSKGEQAVASEMISEFIKEGVPRKQAIAKAIHMAKKHRRKSK